MVKAAAPKKVPPGVVLRTTSHEPRSMESTRLASEETRLITESGAFFDSAERSTV